MVKITEEKIDTVVDKHEALKKKLPHLNYTNKPCFMLANMQTPKFAQIFEKYLNQPLVVGAVEEKKEIQSIFDSHISESFK